MSGKVVAVFGAEGGQGASVARALACRPGYTVRVLTSDVTSAHARRLQDAGASLVAGDPHDRAAMNAALAGAEAAFVSTVTDYADPNCLEKEKQQGRLIADACRATGVRHVVFSSQLHPTRVCGAMVRHMVAKAETEDYMRDAGLPVTCLIVPLCYQDFLSLLRPVSRDGRNFDVLLPTGPTPVDLMSVDDLGPVVFAVLESPSRYLHKTLRVAGDKLTAREVAAVLTAHLAPRTFRDRQMTVHEFAQLDIPGARDWAQMFQFLVREDTRHNPRETQQLHPATQTFEAWVRANRAALDAAFQ